MAAAPGPMSRRPSTIPASALAPVSGRVAGLEPVSPRTTVGVAVRLPVIPRTAVGTAVEPPDVPLTDGGVSHTPVTTIWPAVGTQVPPGGPGGGGGGGGVSGVAGQAVCAGLPLPIPGFTLHS